MCKKSESTVLQRNREEGTLTGHSQLDDTICLPHDPDDARFRERKGFAYIKFTALLYPDGEGGDLARPANSRAVVASNCRGIEKGAALTEQDAISVGGRLALELMTDVAQVGPATSLPWTFGTHPRFPPFYLPLPFLLRSLIVSVSRWN